MENNEYLKLMGAKIKAMRKARKLSLEATMALTGIGMSDLWFLENGRRNSHILTLKAIADAFEVDVKDFI